MPKVNTFTLVTNANGYKDVSYSYLGYSVGDSLIGGMQVLSDGSTVNIIPRDINGNEIRIYAHHIDMTTPWANATLQGVQVTVIKA